MTTRLTLICAAPTSANRIFAFPADEPAEPKALAKLPTLATRLPHADRVFTSPALAARQTAEALGLSATVEPLLRDCDYGSWTGRTLDALQAEVPASVFEWLQDPAAAPHCGESVEALIARASEWLAAFGDGSCLAITHAPIIRAAVVHALGAPATSFWRIDVAPVSMVRLSGAHQRWNLSTLENT
jgi:broad specificity phosphatase PhoE